MDVSRDFFLFLFFLRTSSARGERYQTFYFYFFPCSADHERDWPPCKVVFFGLATNALNVRTTTTVFLHLPSAVLALFFDARRVQPFLSLDDDREVKFCVTINRSPLVGHICIFILLFEEKFPVRM